MLTWLDGFAGLQAVLQGRLLRERRRREPEPRRETFEPPPRFLTPSRPSRETRS